jgi:hypothetical protein
MQTAHHRLGNDAPALGRFNLTRVWSVMVETHMRAASMIIGEVGLEDSH